MLRNRPSPRLCPLKNQETSLSTHSSLHCPKRRVLNRPLRQQKMRLLKAFKISWPRHLLPARLSLFTDLPKLLNPGRKIKSQISNRTRILEYWLVLLVVQVSLSSNTPWSNVCVACLGFVAFGLKYRKLPNFMSIRGSNSVSRMEKRGVSGSHATLNMEETNTTKSKSPLSTFKVDDSFLRDFEFD